MRGVFPLLACLALGLSGCSDGPPQGAVDSASRLLAASMKGDRIAFEAEIDRSAVREDVRRQVTEIARAASLEVDGGPSQFALDRMISPDAVRVVGASGAELADAPTPDQVEPLMKVVADGRVCLREPEGEHDCLLTFAKGRDDEGKSHWRLVGMKARDMTIEVASAGG